jgi:hypothetical protein
MNQVFDDDDDGLSWMNQMSTSNIDFTNIVIHMCPILLTHLAKLSLLNGVGGEFLILKLINVCKSKFIIDSHAQIDKKDS